MINWGILGFGRMGSTFAEAIKETSNSKLISIGSKSQNKSDVNITNDYEEVIKNKNIDAIYIATLNNSHSRLISEICKEKKNILCEKPITTNFQDTLKLSEEIKFTNTKFIEAIAYYSHPQTAEIINIIKQNDIGEIIKIESNFGYKSRVKPNSRIYNKDLGGGALLDLGCYPISFLMLFCKDFDLFKFVNKKILLAETGVDKYAEAKIIYDNNINIEIKVSISSNLDNRCIIQGTKGKIIISDPWIPKNKSSIEIFTGKNYYRKFINSEYSTYANQIQNVSDFFLGRSKNNLNLFDINKSVICMNLINKWKEK